MLLTVASALFAQNITVKGTVTDASNGDSMPAASVVLKGTRTGAVADIDGAYSITVPSNGTLVFSSIGYKTLEVAVNGRGTINVALEPDAESLGDVLVVAYGTAKKESFTGSAQTIKSEQIEKRTVANVTKALDGLAAGIQTTSGSGQPGAGASVIIRGFGSLNASTSPLYVVDGVPYDGSISALNPNDIESMTVIKDASAGALYGARGANGVVIVTTKRGGEGRAKVGFKANVGISSRALPRYETLDAKQWTEDVYFMYKNDYLAEGYSSLAAGQMAAADMSSGANAIFGINEEFNPFSKPVSELFDHTTGKIVDGVTTKWNDDWLELSTDPTPIRQEYQMTVTGGNRANQYMFSMGYLKEEGLVKMTNFERFSGRANVQSQVVDWFKTGLNVSFAHNTTNSTTLGSSGSSSAYSNVFYTCQLMPSREPSRRRLRRLEPAGQPDRRQVPLRFRQCQRPFLHRDRRPGAGRARRPEVQRQPGLRPGQQQEQDLLQPLLWQCRQQERSRRDRRRPYLQLHLQPAADLRPHLRSPSFRHPARP